MNNDVFSPSAKAPIEKSLASRYYQPPRLATGDDVAILVHHRAAMFASMGSVLDAAFTQMVSNCGSWFHAHIAAGTYLGYLIEAAQEPRRVIAGGGLLMLDWPPTHRDPGTTRGYILNVYVEPEHRRRGLARQVTESCVEAARERKISVVTLHSATDARQMYANLGFVATNEMRLNL